MENYLYSNPLKGHIAIKAQDVDICIHIKKKGKEADL